MNREKKAPIVNWRGALIITTMELEATSFFAREEVISPIARAFSKEVRGLETTTDIYAQFFWVK
jgi:hypothetical protein